MAVSTARWKIWKNTAHLRRKVAICAPRVCLVDLGPIGQRGRDENSAPVALLRLERRAAVLPRARQAISTERFQPLAFSSCAPLFLLTIILRPALQISLPFLRLVVGRRNKGR